MVKNKHYKDFLEGHFIEILTEEHIKRVLNNIDHKYKDEARALIIAMYYTGARPVEILNLKGQDVKKAGPGMEIYIRTAKRGKPRTITLSFHKRELVKELYKYASCAFPDAFVFFHFRTKHYKQYRTKAGIKTRLSITEGLYNWFKKWFKDVMDITPYYLRHNRLSQLAEAGATMQELQYFKGSRSPSGVYPYVHGSRQQSKRLSRLIK